MWSTASVRSHTVLVDSAVQSRAPSDQIHKSGVPLVGHFRFIQPPGREPGGRRGSGGDVVAVWEWPAR